MKKLFKIILVIVLMIIFIPSVYAKNDVEITKVELIDKDGYSEELNTPTINNLQFSIDTKYQYEDDYIKYKITIQNNTKNNY